MTSLEHDLHLQLVEGLSEYSSAVRPPTFPSYGPGPATVLFVGDELNAGGWSPPLPPPSPQAGKVAVLCRHNHQSLRLGLRFQLLLEMDKGLRRFPFCEGMGAHPHRHHQVGLEVPVLL